MVKNKGRNRKSSSAVTKKAVTTENESQSMMPVQMNNSENYSPPLQNGQADEGINGFKFEEGIANKLSSYDVSNNHMNGDGPEISSMESSLNSSVSGEDSPLFSIPENPNESSFIQENNNDSLHTTVTPSEDPNKSPQTRLDDLLLRTKYTHVQRNGQRIYGGPPPNWQGGYPAKGSEIFVGKVPHDVFEDEIIPIFEKIGKIYELRLMMNFSGENRGYFFVCYTHPEDAKKAIKELNNYEVRPGKPLGVIHSVDNRKLWISGIPKNRTPAEIKTDMEKLTDGVKNIILYPSLIDKSKTRGYAFVEYESHRAAALARRKLVPGRIFLCGQEVEKIDWAEPETEVDEETMAKVKILFIRNLMGRTSEDHIFSVFNKLSNGQVERVKKSRDYAFVHFASRQAAEKALSEIKSQNGNNLQLDGAEVEVTWSKPVDKYAYNTRKILTKVLTGQNPQFGSYGYLEGSINQSFPTDPIESAMMMHMMNTESFFPIVNKRIRTSAGVKGLGAPGTAPPKNLVRRVLHDGHAMDRELLLQTLPSEMAKIKLNDHEYDVENMSTAEVSNALYHQQQMQNPNSSSPYTDQVIQTLNELKFGGTNCYPYSCLYNNNNILQAPESPASNHLESANTLNDGSSVAVDGNKMVGNNPNVVNAIYAPVNLPMPFPTLPGGYIWPSMYHQFNPMLAAAYGAPYIPAMYSRTQQIPANSQNQSTPVNQQTTQVLSNHRRNFRNRNSQKHVKPQH